MVWFSLSRLAWLARELQGSTCLWIHSAGMTRDSPMSGPPVLGWWGIHLCQDPQCLDDEGSTCVWIPNAGVIRDPPVSGSPMLGWRGIHLRLDRQCWDYKHAQLCFALLFIFSNKMLWLNLALIFAKACTLLPELYSEPKCHLSKYLCSRISMTEKAKKIQGSRGLLCRCYWNQQRINSLWIMNVHICYISEIYSLSVVLYSWGSYRNWLWWTCRKCFRDYFHAMKSI